MEECKLNNQILSELLRQYGEHYHFAWIFTDAKKGPHPAGSVFWTGLRKDFQGPTSPVLKLIQSLFQQYQDQSFFLLRQRIWTDSSVTDFDRGIVKVVAKRLGAVALLGLDRSPVVDSECEHRKLDYFQVGSLDQAFFKLSPDVDGEVFPHPFELGEQLKPAGLLQLLQNLQDQVPRGEVLHKHNREIAAALLDSEGHLLALSLHQGRVNKTLHAEVNLCQSYFEKTGQARFPEGARLFVGLKPCHMCSSLILKMSEGLDNFQCIYLKNDPGRLAHQTLLEQSGRLFEWSIWQKNLEAL